MPSFCSGLRLTLASFRAFAGVRLVGVGTRTHEQTNVVNRLLVGAQDGCATCISERCSATWVGKGCWYCACRSNYPGKGSCGVLFCGHLCTLGSPVRPHPHHQNQVRECANFTLSKLLAPALSRFTGNHAAREKDRGRRSGSEPQKWYACISACNKRKTKRAVGYFFSATPLRGNGRQEKETFFEREKQALR